MDPLSQSCLTVWFALHVVASPSNATWLAFGALGGREGFPFYGISTKFRHRLNELYAAEPFFTGFCGCHVGSSAAVES